MQEAKVKATVQKLAAVLKQDAIPNVGDSSEMLLKTSILGREVFFKSVDEQIKLAGMSALQTDKTETNESIRQTDIARYVDGKKLFSSALEIGTGSMMETFRAQLTNAKAALELAQKTNVGPQAAAETVKERSIKVTTGVSGHEMQIKAAKIGEEIMRKNVDEEIQAKAQGLGEIVLSQTISILDTFSKVETRANKAGSEEGSESIAKVTTTAVQGVFQTMLKVEMVVAMNQMKDKLSEANANQEVAEKTGNGQEDATKVTSTLSNRLSSGFTAEVITSVIKEGLDHFDSDLTVTASVELESKADREAVLKRRVSTHEASGKQAFRKLVESQEQEQASQTTALPDPSTKSGTDPLAVSVAKKATAPYEGSIGQIDAKEMDSKLAESREIRSKELEKELDKNMAVAEEAEKNGASQDLHIQMAVAESSQKVATEASRKEMHTKIDKEITVKVGKGGGVTQETGNEIRSKADEFLHKSLSEQSSKDKEATETATKRGIGSEAASKNELESSSKLTEQESLIKLQAQKTVTTEEEEAIPEKQHWIVKGLCYISNVICFNDWV